ncbi:MAG: hypothetical protein AB7F35_23425, partial [Acetobacteraceae bacterium]
MRGIGNANGLGDAISDRTMRNPNGTSKLRLVQSFMRRTAGLSGCATTALLCLPFCISAPALAATDDEVEILKKAIQDLREQNDRLSRRLTILESDLARRKPPPASQHAQQQPQPPSPQAPAKPPTLARSQVEPPPQTKSAPAPADASLEQRVTDLETAKRAQEDAVRSIIQESMSKTGPKINEFVTLGGAIEVTAARSSNFSGKTSDTVSISTAELDLEIRANEWMLGTLVLNYDSGTNILFPTTNGTNIGVDRVTVDQATVLIGDVQRFPIFMKVGRDVLAFGTSTGTQRLDVLSINNPLSIEVFETRRNAIGVGFAFPTPEPGPPPPPVVVPPVRPLVLNPLVSSLGKWMGYVPSPLRPKPPTPMTFAPRPPPFYGMLYGYDANSEGINRHMSGSL